MNSPFDQSVAQQLLKATPEGLVFDWLVALEEQNQRYARLEKQAVITLEDEANPLLPIPLKVDAGLIPMLYDKAQRLVKLLATKPYATHWELLTAIDPDIAQIYKSASRAGNNTQEAYEELCELLHKARKPAPLPKQDPAEATFYFLRNIELNFVPLQNASEPKMIQNYEKAWKSTDNIGEALEKFCTLLEEERVLPMPQNEPSIPIVPEMQTIAEAALAFLQRIDLNSLSLEQRVSLTGKGVTHFSLLVQLPKFARRSSKATLSSQFLDGCRARPLRSGCLLAGGGKKDQLREGIAIPSRDRKKAPFYN